MHADEILHLALEHHQAGRFTEAVDAYRQALSLSPDRVDLHNNLGSALRSLGDLEAAVSCYENALNLSPNSPEVHNNLANVLQQQNQLDQAIHHYHSAISLDPNFANAHNNLAKAYDDQGQLNQAIASYRRALTLNPNSPRIHSNLIYALHFHPDSTQESLYEEHHRWNNIHAAPLKKLQHPHKNDPTPNRPLRIGYVSPDFRQHPVGRFLLPLLSAHDREKFQIYCYASQVNHDELTTRLASHANVWRNVYDLNDDQLANQIRADEIDILIDLTMHMAGNRLLLFARKPAPIQITYLAYCSTTGLDAIDYRITTRHLDPPPPNQSIYSEQSIHLKTYWCYSPAIDTPAVNELPALHKGHITFGSLNNFCKVTQPTLQTWAQILNAVQNSRLLLYCPTGTPRDRVRHFFESRTIAPHRLNFADFAPLPQYFEQYNQIDIALDPFPYTGGTTTCDALWMGVPVISLTGATAVSRSGLEILTTVGLPELAVETVEQYIHTAMKWATHLAKLRELRTSLRPKMQNSPLTDAAQFSHDIESAYRTIWQTWCRCQTL